MKIFCLTLTLLAVSTCTFAKTDPNLVTRANDERGDDTTLLIRKQNNEKDQRELKRQFKAAEERVAKKRARQPGSNA